VNQIQGLGSTMGGGKQFKAEPLTDEQKQTIQDILSKYDSKNVTAEDAKSIFQEFRDAGIKPGPGMKEAIESAGFNAEDLRAKGRPEGGPPHTPQANSSNSRSGIDLSALKSLQDILSQYDLTNISEEDQSKLLTQLQQQGFMNPGIVVDLKS
jgi:carbamoylphosphate synthase small subunit